jgi:drug/metabolite transporter (DMT)-like permease
MITIILFLIMTISWSLPYFLMKDLSSYLSKYEIIVLSHFVWHVFILLFMLYIWIFYRPKASLFINNVKKLPNKYKSFLIIVTIIGFISQLSYLTLHKTNNISKLVAMLNGLSNIATILIAYFIYKEKITVVKIIGIFLILIGIYIIN